MYLPKELSPEEKFIQYRFWDLEQADIDCGMPVLVTKAYNGEATRDELIALLQKTHALKTHNISLPCDVDYQKITEGLDIRSENVKKGIIQEPSKHTFTDNDQIDAEAIQLNSRIEKMGDRMYTWENRRLFISYLHGNSNVSLYSLKNICIEAFDDELYQVFVQKYISSSNSDKVELCRILLGGDFNNSHYTTPTDREITLKNYNALITMLEKLSEKSNDSIDNAIHKFFIESLKKHITEISSSDKE